MPQEPSLPAITSFSPHVVNIHAPWSVLDVQTVADKCGIQSECFSHSRPLLAQALANSSEFSLLCAEVLRYRLEKARLLYNSQKSNTWNVSGWRTLQWTNLKYNHFSPCPERYCLSPRNQMDGEYCHQFPPNLPGL